MRAILAGMRVPRTTGLPWYYPRLLGGKYEKLLADEKTPPSVARWGFRMNATKGDLRGFVEKHLA